MTSIATAYEVTFHPADPNVSPADCMDTYCYGTLAAAQTAIAEDAKDTAGSILHDDRHAWGAYVLTSTIAAADALQDADTYAYPITVSTGNNPRTIGTYRIRIIHEGDLLECTTCGSGDGRVTAIHGSGNVHATCPDCATGPICPMQCNCEHERHDDDAGNFAGCAHDATGDTRAELVGVICEQCAATCFAEDAAVAKAHGLTPYAVTRTTPGPVDERASLDD